MGLEYLRSMTVNCCRGARFSREDSVGSETRVQLAPTTAGRSGTWETVIANRRVEEAMQTIDFRRGQNFDEAQAVAVHILQVAPPARERYQSQSVGAFLLLT
jgi:hypothetical protein